jgi:drug/metabolite transporter (DMT)-like permease
MPSRARWWDWRADLDAGWFALALGLGSAVTLAACNAFIKSARDILGARAVMSISSAVLMFPAVFLAPLPSPKTWMFLALSLPAHWAYQAALVRALSRGDLSAVFPVMRGSAPLLTAIAAAIILQEHLWPVAIAGLVIASLATIVFALPERGGDGTRLRLAAIGWAIATGVGIAAYNVIDAQGVRSGPSQWSFIVWLFVLDWIGITCVTFLTRGWTAFAASTRAAFRPGLAAGLCSLASFTMALYGFSIAPVAYISAMRETAVVFAALMGWLILKEGFGPRRTLAALVLAGGLGLLQVG